MTATATLPSWKTPRVLAKALGTWAARDDTRPDPKARAAAEQALAAIDAMTAELAALRARIDREAAAYDGEQAADSSPAPAAPQAEPGLTFPGAARALEDLGYEPAAAYDALFAAETTDVYRDGQVTVTMAMDGMTARYTIAPRLRFCLGHLAEDGCQQLAAAHAPGSPGASHALSAMPVLVSGGWPARFAECGECKGRWYDVPDFPVADLTTPGHAVACG